MYDTVIVDVKFGWLVAILDVVNNKIVTNGFLIYQSFSDLVSVGFNVFRFLWEGEGWRFVHCDENF